METDDRVGDLMGQHSVRDRIERQGHAFGQMRVKSRRSSSGQAEPVISGVQLGLVFIDIDAEMQVRGVHVEEPLDRFHDSVNAVFRYRGVLFRIFSHEAHAAADVPRKTVKVPVVRVEDRCVARGIGL